MQYSGVGWGKGISLHYQGGKLKGRRREFLGRKKCVDLGRHRGRKNVREKMSSVSE